MLEEDLRYPRASWAPDSRNWPQRRGEWFDYFFLTVFRIVGPNVHFFDGDYRWSLGLNSLFLSSEWPKNSQYEVYSYSGLGYNCTVRCKSSWTVCSDNCNTILGGTCTLFALVEVRFFEGGEDCFLTVLADFFSELLLTYERRINRLTRFGLSS